MRGWNSVLLLVSSLTYVVKNYNGQLTNQHGVHQRFEDDMVDAYAAFRNKSLSHNEYQRWRRNLLDPLEAAFEITSANLWRQLWYTPTPWFFMPHRKTTEDAYR